MSHLRNHYEIALGQEVFDKIPKAVFAAIAISALTIGGDQLDKAAERLRDEWQVLYENGIVPQKPTF